jgi:hypothetical protein
MQAPKALKAPEQIAEDGSPLGGIRWVDVSPQTGVSSDRRVAALEQQQTELWSHVAALEANLQTLKQTLCKSIDNVESELSNVRQVLQVRRAFGVDIELTSTYSNSATIWTTWPRWSAALRICSPPWMRRVRVSSAVDFAVTVITIKRSWIQKRREHTEHSPREVCGQRSTLRVYVVHTDTLPTMDIVTSGILSRLFDRGWYDGLRQLVTLAVSTTTGTVGTVDSNKKLPVLRQWFRRKIGGHLHLGSTQMLRCYQQTYDVTPSSGVDSRKRTGQGAHWRALAQCLVEYLGGDVLEGVTECTVDLDWRPLSVDAVWALNALWSACPRLAKITLQCSHPAASSMAFISTDVVVPASVRWMRVVNVTFEDRYRLPDTVQRLDWVMFFDNVKLNTQIFYNPGPVASPSSVQVRCARRDRGGTSFRMVYERPAVLWRCSPYFHLCTYSDSSDFDTIDEYFDTLAVPSDDGVNGMDTVHAVNAVDAIGAVDVINHASLYSWGRTTTSYRQTNAYRRPARALGTSLKVPFLKKPLRRSSSRFLAKCLFFLAARYFLREMMRPCLFCMRSRLRSAFLLYEVLRAVPFHTSRREPTVFTGCAMLDE